MNTPTMYESKQIIIFDLDGTLTPSKSTADEEMVALLRKLLQKKKVAVISGGAFKQFKKQFVSVLTCSEEELKNLFLFPTCSTIMYKYHEKEWHQEYAEVLNDDEKKKIFEAFDSMFSDLNYTHPAEVWGDILEDRETQVTYSAHGQHAPLEVKEVWDPDQKKRLRMIADLHKYIPEFELRVGGTTSIDVTHKGIDKRYGIQKIEKLLNIPIKDMLFVGDAVFPGGNDYPAKEAGVETIQVEGPEQTKELIRSIVGS